MALCLQGSVTPTRRDIMRHALDRERYSKGASLEKLAGIIQSIAI